jgi:type II secretory pathway component GspD/PulD (secretin)
MKIIPFSFIGLLVFVCPCVRAQNTPDKKDSHDIGIDVILNDAELPKTAAPKAMPSTDDASAIKIASSSLTGYRIMSMPLNDFAQAMAQRAGMTYVANPVVKGVVNGRFSDADPLGMLKVAARANGYQMVVSDGAIELVNKDVLAALPDQTYTHTFRYLRFPGKNDKSDDKAGDQASNQAAKMESLFAGLLSEKAYIKYDPKTNTLVARDVDSRIALLDDLVKRLDVERPNVLVGVTILEVNATPRDFAGMDWQNTLGANGFSTTLDIANSLASVLTGGAFSAAPKYAVIIRPGQVRVVLRALSLKNLAEVRAQFFVGTEDNESGHTTVARQEPVPRFQNNQQTGGFDISGFDYKPVGNTLQVIPQLLPQNIVRLTIKPELSTLDEFRTISSSAGSGGGLSVQVPVISERSTEVIVRVPIGRSLMIGGLKELGLTDNSNKIPVLGDIPGIKYLFRSKDVTRTTRNLVLIVEPTTLDPREPESIEKVTEDYKNSMKYNPHDKLKDLMPGANPSKPVSGFVDDKF